VKRDSYPLTLLYDGACAICALEMDKLHERDGLRRLRFVDISMAGFDAHRYGATLDAMRDSIHGVRPDGSLAIGVEALVLAYRAVGLGAFMLPARLPMLRPLLDRAYRAFARNRYGVSRVLMPAIERMAARRALRRSQRCRDGACETDSAGTAS
jgi:predicted DCC family thiol-disulfide oxidoreductase YuxK